jgi:glyoxylate carboligase
MNRRSHRSSQTQYERKLSSWEVSKNLKRKEWQKIIREYEQRERAGLKSTIFIDNVVVQPDRVTRELARTQNHQYRG